MTIDDPVAARLVQVLEKLEERLAQPAASTARPVIARRWVSLAEAMELLNVKRTRLFGLIAEKKIIRLRDGLRAGIDAQSIEDYLTARIAQAGGIVPPKRGRPRKTDAQREAAKIAKLKP